MLAISTAQLLKTENYKYLCALQDDLVFGSGIGFGLHKLTFSYGRSRATRNPQKYPIKYPKQKHSLLPKRLYIDIK